MKNVLLISLKMASIVFALSAVTNTIILLSQIPFFFTAFFGLFMLLLTILAYGISFFYLKGEQIMPFRKIYPIFLLAFLFNSLLSVPFNMFIHHYLAPEFKVQLANYEVNKAVKQIKDIEARENVKMEFDEEKEYQRVIDRYDKDTILRSPLVNLPSSLVVALLLSVCMLKIQSSKNKYHQSPML